MSLTNTQLNDLAKRMKVPLEAVVFKSELVGMKLKHNRSYIINLANEFDEDGKLNDGSHYTCFQSNKNVNGKVENIYFDSFGVDCPKEVLNFLGVKHVPYNTKEIQSIQLGFCGWACLAFLYYINVYPDRTKSLYDDCEYFTDLFHDLNKSSDHKFNEFVLKCFFRPSDPKLREKYPLSIFGKDDIQNIADPNSITKRD